MHMSNGPGAHRFAAWSNARGPRHGEAGAQYPIAQPSLRGSEPPIRTPCSGSMRMAW